MDELTPAQARVLDAIRARVDEGLAPPTYIVCATLDGETTLRIFEPRDDGAWLVPANVACRPIKLTSDSPVHGVLLATMRLYGAPQMKRSRERHSPAPKVSIA